MSEKQDKNQRSEGQGGRLGKLDLWMEGESWRPRVLPFILYLGFLMVIGGGVDYVGLGTYPFLYALQCGLVLWLLIRYRQLIPEMNWKFHWLAVPTGLGLTWAWIKLGMVMSEWQPGLFSYENLKVDHPFAKMAKDESEVGLAIYYSSISLRLLGMSIVVPMFEELFTRSLCLRALHSPKKTWLGVKQLMHDMPIIGDRYMHTESGRKASLEEPAFTWQFEHTELGNVSLFAVVASTLVFIASHVPRDWPGCVACGVVWCAMIWWTNRKGLKKKLGLGPVIWSHGITNAALWAWSLYYVNEFGWQYL